MASLNFTITATQAEFDDFANRLGYMANIETGTDGEGQPIIAPNPETRPSFLQRVMKEAVAARFYEPFVRDIDAELRNQREADKEAMRTVVRDRVVVTYTP